MNLLGLEVSLQFQERLFEKLPREGSNRAEKLCGGLMTPLLTHLVRAEALTAQERKEVRDLIDELDRKSKSGRR